MRRFIALIPELHCKAQREWELFYPGLKVLPDNHRLTVQLKKELSLQKWKVEHGTCLYYEGELEQDIEPYEVFYAYCLALTFFSEQSHVTCRALKDLDQDLTIQININEFDQFRVAPEDIIELKAGDRQKLSVAYKRIRTQLATREFNPLRNAVEFWTIFARERGDPRVRLLQLSVCFESLFTSGDANEGINYKLGTRCAAFLSHFDNEVHAADTFKEVKTAYDLRSAIIHGVDYKKKAAGLATKSNTQSSASGLDHVSILERILKRAFCNIFMSDEWSAAAQNKDGGFGKKIDRELVWDKLDNTSR